MTGKVRDGLISAGKIGQFCAKNVPFRILALGLASVLDLFVETVKKQAVDHPIPTLYQDDHPCVVDNFGNVPICLTTNTHPQLITVPRSTNSTSFPPFLLLGAGMNSCSQYFDVMP